MLMCNNPRSSKKSTSSYLALILHWYAVEQHKQFLISRAIAGMLRLSNRSIVVVRHGVDVGFEICVLSMYDLRG